MRFRSTLAAVIGLLGGAAIVIAGDAYLGKPYGEHPAAVPGTILAVEYDVSHPDITNGVSFNYNGKFHKTDIRKSADSIGLARFDKSHVTTKGEPEDTKQTYLGWTHAGEWVKYRLTVAKAGKYVIGLHVAAAQKGGTISFSFDAGDKNVTTGPIEIPTTAGYQPGVEVYHVWERLDKIAEVELPAGETVMTMKIEKSGGFNIESISLTAK